MLWSGLEYLKVPQWRLAFEAADVSFGIDVATRQKFLVFGRAALVTSEATEMMDHLRVLQSVDRLQQRGPGDAHRCLRSLPRTPRL